MKKIIVCTKDLESKGGVANFYREIKLSWDYEDCNLLFFEIGSNSKVYENREKRYFGYFYESFKQYRAFYKLLKSEQPDKVIVNPSLIPVAIIRDAIYILICDFLKIETITFIRGWRENFFKKLLSYFFLKIFKKI